MNSSKRRWIRYAALAVLFPSLMQARAPLGGALHLEGGKVQEFADVVSLVFSLPEGAESIPQNVNEWPRVYDSASVSRSAPLSWVRSIEVLRYETKPGYRCLFNPLLSIETVSGAVIESQLKTLEWIRIKTLKGEDQTFYFVSGEKIQIRKIVFKSK
jgi:hypothetical protein